MGPYTSTMFVNHVDTKAYVFINEHSCIIDIKMFKHDKHVETKLPFVYIANVKYASVVLEVPRRRRCLESNQFRGGWHPYG